MKTYVCIVCPTGCTLEVTHAANQILVSGNQCKRGELFAISEETSPERTLCSTVRTRFESMPVLPIKTERTIPKSKIPEVMGILSHIVIETPLHCGDTVVENVLGLGVNIVATSDLYTS